MEYRPANILMEEIFYLDNLIFDTEFKILKTDIIQIWNETDHRINIVEFTIKRKKKISNSVKKYFFTQYKAIG
jgi:hypothetical protein